MKVMWVRAVGVADGWLQPAAQRQARTTQRNRTRPRIAAPARTIGHRAIAGGAKQVRASSCPQGAGPFSPEFAWGAFRAIWEQCPGLATDVALFDGLLHLRNGFRKRRAKRSSLIETRQKRARGGGISAGALLLRPDFARRGVALFRP